MFRQLLVCLVCFLPASWIAAQQPQAKNKTQTVLKISPETTHITEPLDERGFVDYVQAVNDMASKGVTPENNYEVVVRQVVGPKQILESMREEYYKLLGIPITESEVIDYFKFRKSADKAKVMDEYERGMEAPWNEADVPELAAWLASIKPQLDTIVAGSRRTHYYTPYISEPFDDDEQAYPRMIAMLLPSAQGQRDLARTLGIRANLRLGSGDLDAAWDDILAIFRIGRLSAQGITLIENLVGIAIDGIAHHAAVNLLQSPKLTDDLARRCLKDLQQLPPLASTVDKIDSAERFMGLDALQTLATQPNLFRTLALIENLSNAEPAKQLDAANGTTLVVFQQPNAGPASTATFINWNVTAKMLNQWYDRLVAAGKEKDVEKRKAAFAKIDQDIQQLSKSMANSPAAMLRVLGGQPEDEIGKMIGNVLVALLLPAIDAATQAEFVARARADVLRLAFAAEVYRRDTGFFPDQLAKLKPNYIQEIPDDRLSGKPLRYSTSKQRMILYSVGRNGTDDRGRGRDDNDDDRQGWDDIVIRLGAGG